jgi:hypothetical protein
MKQSQIRPGLPVMISRGGRKGSVRTTVRDQWKATGMSTTPIWTVVDSEGNLCDVTPRQMRPVPVTDKDGTFIGYEHEIVTEQIIHESK